MLNIIPLLVVITNMQVVQPVIIKTSDMELEFTARTPDQMGSFYEARGLPTTFLINPKGEVKYQAIGGREWDNPTYIQFIKQLISSLD